MKLAIILSMLSALVTGVLLFMNIFAMVAVYGGPITTLVYALWLLFSFMAVRRIPNDWTT